MAIPLSANDHPDMFAAPNMYQLRGGDITVSYLPVGPGGQPHVTYERDHQQPLQFRGDEIRRVEVQDAGMLVSVTVVATPDFGSTSFSFLVPRVNLPNQRGALEQISTEGITTLHRLSPIPPLNHGQVDLYTVTPMTGTASLNIIPL